MSSIQSIRSSLLHCKFTYLETALHFGGTKNFNSSVSKHKQFKKLTKYCGIFASSKNRRARETVTAMQWLYNTQLYRSPH